MIVVGDRVGKRAKLGDRMLILHEMFELSGMPCPGIPERKPATPEGVPKATYPLQWLSTTPYTSHTLSCGCETSNLGVSLDTLLGFHSLLFS
jgi:hypothetical protein